jgi:hypothetical protein
MQPAIDREWRIGEPVAGPGVEGAGDEGVDMLAVEIAGPRSPSRDR